MHKRSFLKLSSLMMAAPLIGDWKVFAQEEELKNWAGNITYSTNQINYAKSTEEVQQLIRSYPRLKILGTRHCFNTIADSKDRFVSLRDMNKVVGLDRAANTVTVEAGIKYGELAPWLDAQGYALHNLASLPHISVAGAITTATHGSGVGNGNLSSAVAGLEFVLADGSMLTLTEKDGDRFKAAVVGLGALGALTKVTLRVMPTFEMRQHVYLDLPFEQALQHFDELMSSAYSVSLFTDWSQPRINEVWVKSLVSDTSNTSARNDFYGSIPATKDVHPIIDIDAINCTPQMGVAGPWYERLPHFKMGFTPRSGKELQSEFFIARKNAPEAMQAIQKMGTKISPHLFISEIRTIAADDLWMSPCYHQDSVTIHFTWKQETEAVMRLLPLIEKELSVFNVKPHWGKLFTVTKQALAGRYEKMEDFRKLVSELDPTRKFANAFLNEKIY